MTTTQHDHTIQALIAAALYDFAGRLTTMKPSVKVGSDAEVYPVITALQTFLKERGLETKQDPPITTWADMMTLRSLAEEMDAASPKALCFKEALAQTINRWGKDTDYGMPDFALALLVEQMLDAVGRANATRERFLGGTIGERVAAEYGLPMPSEPEVSVIRLTPMLVHPMGSMGEEVDIPLDIDEGLAHYAPWPFPKT